MKKLFFLIGKVLSNFGMGLFPEKLEAEVVIFIEIADSVCLTTDGNGTNLVISSLVGHCFLPRPGHQVAVFKSFVKYGEVSKPQWNISDLKSDHL